MRFTDIRLTDLIDILENTKHSNLVDCHCVTRCSGEIHIYNGENKDGTKKEMVGDIE